jgi:hypothetical protein
MQLSLGQKDSHIDISEGAARISLCETAVLLNDYVIDFPGEYERSLIFAEVRETKSGLIWILTLEGKTIIYLPQSTTVESLDALRDVNNKDMVIFPANEALWKTLETWEVSVAVPYESNVSEFVTKLGQSVEMTPTATVKAVDFESEKTRFITLG